MGKIADFLKAKQKVEVVKLNLVTLQRGVYLATLGGSHKGTAYIFLTKEPPAALVWEVLTAICDRNAVPDDWNVEFIPAYADVAAPTFSWDDDLDGAKLSLIQKYVTTAICEHNANEAAYDKAWAQHAEQTNTILGGLLFESTSAQGVTGADGKIVSHLGLSPAARHKLSDFLSAKMQGTLCVIGHLPSASDFISGFQDMSDLADSLLTSGESYKLGKYDEQVFPDEKHRTYVMPVAYRCPVPRILRAKEHVVDARRKMQASVLTESEAVDVLGTCGLSSESFGIHKQHICSLSEICAKTMLTWADLNKFQKKELSDAMRIVERP